MEPLHLVCGLPFVAFLLDVALSLSWAPFYFRYGVPLLWLTWPLLNTRTLSDYIPLIERTYAHDIRPVIEFQALGPNEYAFQEKVIKSRGGLRYLYIMHGYLGIDSNNQQLVLIGFAKWYVVIGLAFLLSVLIVAFASEFTNRPLGLNLTDFLLLIPVSLVVLLFYGIQTWRYYHVGKTTADLLSQAT